MAVSREEVDKIAGLACLSLGAEEAERMSRELSRILEHVEKFRALDLAGVEPTAHAIELPTAFRADQPAPGLATPEALYNAPEAADGLFVVPKVIKDR